LLTFFIFALKIYLISSKVNLWVIKSIFIALSSL